MRARARFSVRVLDAGCVELSVCLKRVFFFFLFGKSGKELSEKERKHKVDIHKREMSALKVTLFP
jgi:hypothetical protein